MSLACVIHAAHDHRVEEETARALGLDLKRFASDRNGKASLEAIDRDRALADRLGLEGTPFFVVDGRAGRTPVRAPAPAPVREEARRRADAPQPARQSCPAGAGRSNFRPY
jgi:protein-disulfide isomerase-like protein with CxxC motif